MPSLVASCSCGGGSLPTGASTGRSDPWSGERRMLAADAGPHRQLPTLLAGHPRYEEVRLVAGLCHGGSVPCAEQHLCGCLQADSLHQPWIARLRDGGAGQADGHSCGAQVPSPRRPGAHPATQAAPDCAFGGLLGSPRLGEADVPHICLWRPARLTLQAKWHAGQELWGPQGGCWQQLNSLGPPAHDSRRLAGGGLLVGSQTAGCSNAASTRSAPLRAAKHDWTECALVFGKCLDSSPCPCPCLQISK